MVVGLAPNPLIKPLVIRPNDPNKLEEKGEEDDEDDFCLIPSSTKELAKDKLDFSKDSKPSATTLATKPSVV
ncbi:hypothetical protein IAQ61_000001 [Plenodomus lingam]|uniref:uncharacterized protein n=1 Tax=Leptosphaeria maculans TaxID=5022 RepID=UPI00331D192D|nr:hypothetical protein IAQ61_000001 [Plenodomus lingam]